MSERVKFDQVIVKMIEAIRRKVGADSLEIGYEPDPVTGVDPRPGDPTTWYVVVEFGTTKIRRQARGVDEKPVIEALAATMEAVGLRVRVRYE